MALISIENVTYEANKKHNLLEAVLSLGFNLPYFCWHPSMGSIGSCRQCAVQQFANEEDKTGKLIMACMNPVKDGVRISINHPTCTNFRKAVIEWMMINHPHDCPVCDEGGECHLQDMTLMTGHNYRRYRFKKRTFTNQNLGPLINHEMNRCITCYRCVRYYQDIAHGKDLSAFSSSSKVYFGRFQEGVLENPFSGNLVEVCPTGVFTDKTFHEHYVRKWDLETSPSVCQLCSLGCNISLGARNHILRRVQNRYHNDINGFFLCDKGRFGHDYVNSHQRLDKPVSSNNINMSSNIDFIRKLKNDGNIVGIGSPRASLEANWALKNLVGIENFYDGLSDHESEACHMIAKIITSKSANIASLKDIRESDFILILGEDVSNTAPLIDLSIRQAYNMFNKNIAKENLDVDDWHDSAIRNNIRENLIPLFIATTYQSSLDNIAKIYQRIHPYDLSLLAYDIFNKLKEEKLSNTWPEEIIIFINDVVSAFKNAQKPIIISGSSMNDEALIYNSYNLANINEKCLLSLVLPDCNTLGLLMLKPIALKNLNYENINKPKSIIILENDLINRLGQKRFNSLTKEAFIITIDTLLTETMKQSSLSIPSSSFTETTASIVNNEGRLQKYFSVIPNKEGLNSSFYIIRSIIDKNTSMNIDEAEINIADDLQINKDAFDNIFHAEYRKNGQKIALQAENFSGRTALFSHISVHEDIPNSDPDSPMVFSMEGARKKIPLSLISSYTEPGWTSLQSSYKKNLGILKNTNENPGGFKLFNKESINLLINIQDITKNKSLFPEVLIIPMYHLFSSMELVKFTKHISQLIPLCEALISEEDLKNNKILTTAKIILETKNNKFAITAKSAKLPKGIIILPHGLIDNEIFFTNGLVKIIDEETV